MKKALSLLVVMLLILSLSGACWADAARPDGAPAQVRQLAGSLKAELRGDGTPAAQFSGAATLSYTRTYTRQRTSPLAKAIAAGILGAIVGLINAIRGKGKKKNAPPETVQETPSVPDPNKFICRSCGKTSAGWYQVCPSCGAAGRIERITAEDLRTLSNSTPAPAPQSAAPVSGYVPPEGALSGAHGAFAALLASALQFQTDSGLRDYLQRNAGRVAVNEKARLDALLRNEDLSTLRSRTQDLLDFLCRF